MTAAPASAAGASIGVRRVVAGVLLAVLSVASMLWAPSFTLLVILIDAACLWEFEQLSARKGPALEFPVAFAAVVAYMVLTHLHLIRQYESTLLGVTVIVALATATFAGKGGGGAFARSGFTLLGVLYIGKLSTYFVAIRALPVIGLAASIELAGIVAATDVFAMVVGTRIGRTPLTPVSPRKTVEGSIGGLAAAVVVGIVAAATPWLHGPWWQGAFVGALTSVAAQAGDLVESAYKRDAHVKDAGRLIAGHGGALDRFDSYLFAGIAFYFALWLIGAIPHGASV